MEEIIKYSFYIGYFVFGLILLYLVFKVRNLEDKINGKFGVPKMDNTPEPPAFYGRMKCLGCGNINFECTCKHDDIKRPENKAWNVNGHQPKNNYIPPLESEFFNLTEITPNVIMGLFDCSYENALKFHDYLNGFKNIKRVDLDFVNNLYKKFTK